MTFSRHIREAFIHGISLLGVSFLYRTLMKRHSPLVRVLVFHDVQDGAWFEETIRNIKEVYHVISPEDFFAQKFDERSINILVTFDDGYASWVHTCLPILERYGVRALFFINSGLIDAQGDREAQRRYVREKLLRSPRETLSWDGVRTLSDAGHTIGGHTIHHERLGILPEEAQVKEIKDDKSVIERELGRPIAAFAYPFGNSTDYTETTVRVVKGVQYTHAFTTAGTFADTRNAFAVPRMCVEDNQSQASLNRWMRGGYDIYRGIKQLCAR